MYELTYMDKSATVGWIGHMQSDTENRPSYQPIPI